MTKEKRVMIIWDADYPWDIRVDKIARSLIRAGYRVSIACRNTAGQSTFELSEEGIRIYRLPFLQRGPKKLRRLFTFPLFFNPIWLTHLRKVVKKERPDLIVVRDLPLAVGGIWIGRLISKPVVLDMAECYPEFLKNRKIFGGAGKLDWLVRNPAIAAQVEKYVFKHIRHVWCMVEESQERSIALGCPRSRTSIVSNTPELSRFDIDAIQSNSVNRSENQQPLSIFYVGLINYARGLDRVLIALRRMGEAKSDFRFDVFGSGRGESWLRDQIDELGLNAAVSLHGWIDPTEVPKRIEQADICIVPHPRCPHWDHTLPNKLFDYMAAGKPVLVSDVPPMARIVTSTQCGLIYEDGNHQDLASKLLTMRDPILRKKLGSHGREAVLTKYNWSHDEQQLQQDIVRLLDA